MALLVCPRCGKEEFGQALRCRSCGAALPHKTIMEMPSLGNPQEEDKRCQKCQAKLPPLASRCPVCGESIVTAAAKAPKALPQRSTTVADRGLSQQKIVLQQSPATPAKVNNANTIFPDVSDSEAERLQAQKKLEAAQRKLQSAAEAQKIPPAVIISRTSANAKSPVPPLTSAPIASKEGEVRVQLKPQRPHRPMPAKPLPVTLEKRTKNKAKPSPQKQDGSKAKLPARTANSLAATQLDMPALHLSKQPQTTQKDAPLNKSQTTETAMQPIPADESFAPTLQMPRVDVEGTNNPAPRQAEVATLATLPQVPAPQSPAPQASATQTAAAQAATVQVQRPQVCPHCAAEVGAGSKFCGQCGTVLAEAKDLEHRSDKSLAKPASAAKQAPPTKQNGSTQTAESLRIKYMSPFLSKPENHDILQGLTIIGRALDANLRLKHDPYISPRHAKLELQGDSVRLTPLSSTNGVFVRLRRPMKVSTGTRLRIGDQLMELRIDDLQGPQLLQANDSQGTRLLGSPQAQQGMRILQLFAEGSYNSSVHLGRTLSLGRSHCDLNFPADPKIDPRHSRILRAGDATVVEDLNTKNGTFIQVLEPLVLHPGEQILLGQTLLFL